MAENKKDPQENGQVLSAVTRDNDQLLWSETKVKLLLTLYLAHLEDFENPRCKRKDIWKKIAKELGSTVGACDSKFRNLKCYYIGILKRKADNSALSWPYFQIFEEIFCHDPNVQLERATAIEPLMEIGDASLPRSPSSEPISRYASKDSNDAKNQSRLAGNAEFRDFEVNMSRFYDRVSNTLDSLINHMEEANEIQKNRNKLLGKYHKIMLRR
ncbi:uncharacterized protein [Euwallacea fornicatus]|uniref:uncharacterized protein isoform X2 n=1 Tax=Euwallacea fornicatus TaxID=995702 RepID=UPI00338F7DCA